MLLFLQFLFHFFFFDKMLFYAIQKIVMVIMPELMELLRRQQKYEKRGNSRSGEAMGQLK